MWPLLYHVPNQCVSQHRIDANAILSGRNHPALTEAVFEISCNAKSHIEHARRLSNSLPKTASPYLLSAVGHCTLHERLLSYDWHTHTSTGGNWPFSKRLGKTELWCILSQITKPISKTETTTLSSLSSSIEQILNPIFKYSRFPSLSMQQLSLEFTFVLSDFCGVQGSLIWDPEWAVLSRHHAWTKKQIHGPEYQQESSHFDQSKEFTRKKAIFHIWK